ncbi:MAG: hypothetical protein AAGM22_04825 [Acidobacteriota bacterium]
MILRNAPRALALPVVLVAFLAAPVVEAELCAPDNVPAATLLLPYFEVDLESADCISTLLSINNASSSPTIAHVTFWTDWSQPTLDFDLFLTGYDVQTVNLRNVFFDAALPVTADEQTDPTDSISPHGLNPAWDGSFIAPPNCANFFPFDNPVIPATNLERLINGHTGQPVSSAGGLCLGQDHGDGHARGYITIDDARRCSLEFASDPSYFGGLDPVATNENQLWGDFFIWDPANDVAIGHPLVHIEADDSFDASSTPTGATFYGRYTSPSGLDNREPLGTTWAVRYLNGGAFDGGTELIVWRDSTIDGDPNASFTCGQGPEWFPLNETEVVAFDEQEDAVELCFDPGGGIISPPITPVDPACFPLETQRVKVGEGDLTPPYDFGWLYLNLNINDMNLANDVDFGSAGDIAQSWVGAIHTAEGLYQVGFNAVQLTGACEDVNPVLTSSWNIPQP